MTMRKIFLMIFIISLSWSLYAGKVIITNVGTSFSPASVSIKTGDTVVFQLALSHNAVEVSQSTYNSNGNTSNGGFSLPFGGGSIVLSKAGTFYYVCTPHASFGMKGIIIVTQSTGIENVIVNRSFELYRNPGNNSIIVTANVTGQTTMNYVLWDASGRKVYSKSVFYQSPGTITENLQPAKSLSNGLYILSATSKNGLKYSEKLLVSD